MSVIASSSIGNKQGRRLCEAEGKARRPDSRIVAASCVNDFLWRTKGLPDRPTLDDTAAYR